MSDSAYIIALRRELASSLTQRNARKRAEVVAEIKRAGGAVDGEAVETATRRGPGRPKKVAE